MKRDRKGFTIIEAVLVLAIAGLIFVMVFIALPSLQRGQRNTQRRNDLAIIAAAMNTWRSKHGNVSVSDNYSKAFEANGFCTFYNHYVDADMTDPSTGEAYRISLWNTTYVINCVTNKKINRRAYDSSAIGRSPNSNWAKMEVGDIQYDDVAMCDGEVFNDELGKSAGMHAFALRMYLEGGATICMDNGYSSSSE